MVMREFSIIDRGLVGKNKWEVYTEMGIKRFKTLNEAKVYIDGIECERIDKVFTDNGEVFINKESP